MISVNDLSFLVRKSVRKHAKVHEAHKSAQKHVRVSKSVQKCVKAILWTACCCQKSQLIWAKVQRILKVAHFFVFQNQNK
jgi:hypothetical protein